MAIAAVDTGKLGTRRALLGRSVNASISSKFLLNMLHDCTVY